MSYRGRKREGDSMLGAYDEKLNQIEEMLNEKVSAFIPPQLPWSMIAYATTGIYACLACLIVFAREDFINVFL